ncbi:cupin domain-containing protein [Hahella aquimaris]|uniref:cupin domain-containing protein n=1 Tax=Hahella sp. HNIBRBA332 TaxID=3015983 RepID=UPI00273BFD53|nr:cupin domain-containing protein [Hahella sp. HNIBRBA332]WLQ15361.1 cupin domain-containing protein [Hahella sp. HNIBRBA332]
MLTHLGDISVADFLAHYWQKKPLIIRGLFPGYECPLDENDLAGLATEEEVESRLVYEELNGLPWQLEHGPFSIEKLENMPLQGWTLLVQGLDTWVPEVADLLDRFRFLPNWRVDDVMASFAPPGGSVGPHFDHYDVFLIQATGARRWRIGPPCDHQSPRVDGTPLRILQNFEQTEEWVLEPGDALYLPPRYAHYGIAETSCITLSVGFRSPTYAELMSALADDWFENPALSTHLHDATEAPLNNPGLISDDVFADIKSRLQALLDDEAGLRRSFGRFISAPKFDAAVPPLEADMRLSPEDAGESLQDQEIQWRWNEGSRYTYSLYEEAGARRVMFAVDGEAYDADERFAPLVEILCRSNNIDRERLLPWSADKDALKLLSSLLNRGSLVLEGFDDDEEHWDDDDA